MINHLVIIPYRDRESHLKYFLNNVYPLIEKHLMNSRLVVIEQNEENLFNKGALINIAYDIFKDKAESLIIHDIDIYPNEKCIKKYYKQDSKGVIGICVSPSNTLGGVVKISNKHFNEVNGFPNNFWGWGVEDKAFQNRVEHRKIHIKKNFIRSKGRFDEYFISDETNHSRIRNKKSYRRKHMTHYEWWNNFSSKTRENILNSTGINNLKYQINSKKNYGNYDHYIVKILRYKNNLNFFDKIRNYFIYY